MVLDHSKSILEIVPPISEIPEGGEAEVRYCVKDQNGDPIDYRDLALNFDLQFGSSVGTFSPVTFNSADKCYEATFTAMTPGTPADITLLESARLLEPTLPIEVTPARLAFTGVSRPSEPVVNRIVTAGAPFIVSGECDTVLGNVTIKGPIRGSASDSTINNYTTPCLSDGSFSLPIHTDGATVPYFSGTDPLVMIKQAQLVPKVTRIYNLNPGWTNVFISTPAQLQAMTVSGASQTKNYILTADIDLASVGATNNFNALGNDIVNFWSGRLYGDGHAIKNLHINGGGGSYKGLIGYAASVSEVYDLSFTNATILNCASYCGVFAGMWRWTAVAARISVSGNITGTGTNTGLLAGYSHDGKVYDSWTTGSVSGASAAGIIGLMRGGYIQDSWSDADVTATATASGGGIATSAFGGFRLFIDRSFSMGTISGAEGVGGLIGHLSPSSMPSQAPYNLTHNFSLGNIIALPMVNYASGPIIGSPGYYDMGAFTFTPGNFAGNLHLSTASCTNCDAQYNTSSNPATVAEILNMTRANWDYTWKWKTHSSGARPDLIANPRP